MKIAYISSHILSNTEGVTKKIINQIKTWREFGNDVLFINIGKHIDFNHLEYDYLNYESHYIENKWKSKFGINFDLLDSLSKFNPDIVYLRYDLWSVTYDYILRNYKTVIEIQTDDINEYKLQKSIKGRLRYLYLLAFRDKFLSKAEAFITVTKELCDLEHYKKYNKPTIYIPNSIRLKDIDIIKMRTSKQDKIKLFFIGTSNFPWHGIDLIEKIAKKLPEFEFHIVGEYNKYGRVGNMFFYGRLKYEEYSKIMRDCQVCIGTLALHRKNMTEASPLKTREYLAHGFPVIIGYKDTAFLQSKPDYVCEVDFSDENITNSKIEIIRDFVYKNVNRIVEHKEVFEFIASEYLEKNRIDFLKSLL